MRTPSSLVDTCDQRSYLCPDYELRVTARCVVEDLSQPSTTPFEDLLQRDEIVKALVNKRRDEPTDTDPVTGLTCARTVYKLRYGNDHRGATWHDKDNGVVWLLAYGWHRVHDPNDAFRKFVRLDAEERLLPTAADYNALLDDRDRRVARVAHGQAQDLLREAESNLGQEQRGIIGDCAHVGVVIEVVETLSEIEVIFDHAATPRTWVMALPAWFIPESGLDDWDWNCEHPSRELADTEACIRYLKG